MKVCMRNLQAEPVLTYTEIWLKYSRTDSLASHPERPVSDPLLTGRSSLGGSFRSFARKRIAALDSQCMGHHVFVADSDLCSFTRGPVFLSLSQGLHKQVGGSCVSTSFVSNV